MFKDRWFRFGLVGAVIGGLCCFTPLAVWGVAAIGLGAFVGLIDVIALPLLIGGVVMCVASFLRLRKAQA